MGPQEFHDLMNAKPFRPFRLRLTNGESLDVLRNLTGFSMSDRISVGYDYGDHGHPTRCRYIAYPDIAGFDLLDPAVASRWH